MVFWVMWLFKIDWVRKTMGFLGVILIVVGMFSIYLSLEARDSNALKLTKISKDIYLSITFMTSSVFVLGVLALVMGWKNPRSWRIIFTIGCSAVMALYLYYGIKIRVITSEIKTSLESYECDMLGQYQFQAAYDNSIDDSKSATYTIKDSYIEFFNTIYSMARTSYCKKSPDGCPWMNSPVVVADFYYDSTDDEVVTKMQGWTDKILGSYEKYELILNQAEFISYFNFIGDLEQRYSWAGFCAQEEAYYFSDITKGPPHREWDNAIINEVIPYEINIYAQHLIIIASILFMCLFIHAGLFKKTQAKVMDEEGFKSVQNVSSTMVITQNMSRLDDESQVSKF